MQKSTTSRDFLNLKKNREKLNGLTIIIDYIHVLIFESQIVKENNPLKNSGTHYKLKVLEFEKMTKLFSTRSFFIIIEIKFFF